MAEKEKQLEEARKEKLRLEREKQKRKENLKHVLEQQQKLAKVRPLASKKGKAIANGKMCTFYDWSTSPDPAFVNQNEWKS